MKTAKEKAKELVCKIIYMEKKVLTPEEITLEVERRKNIRRQRLEEKIIELTKECDREDVIYVFSSLINRITK